MNLVSESIKFMMLGVGVVFLFLLLMIFAMRLLSYIVAFFDSGASGAPLSPAEGRAEDVETAHIAAITAAIEEYRKNRQFDRTRHG